MNDQEIEKAIDTYLDQYSHNLPDGLDIILSAVTRHFLFHVEDNPRAQQKFRDMACEIINNTGI
jgi:hypothetical protein